MSRRAVFVLSLCVTGMLAGCATGPTWQETAASCYQNWKTGTVSDYRGRRGLEACDLYVSNMRAAEAQRSQENAFGFGDFLNAVGNMPLMSTPPQQPAPAAVAACAGPPAEDMQNVVPVRRGAMGDGVPVRLLCVTS